MRKSEITNQRSVPRCFQSSAERSNSIDSGSAKRRFGRQGVVGSTRTALGEANASATAANAVRPHTAGQLRAIYALGRKRGLDNDDLHDSILSGLANNSIARRTGSFTDLTFSEAERAIARLKGRDFVPLRTLQHRRAKSGVVQIVTDEQLTKIAFLATQRKWSPQTLTNFCVRQCGHPVRTTVDANKVIEALKAMNERDHLWVA